MIIRRLSFLMPNSILSIFTGYELQLEALIFQPSEFIYSMLSTLFEVQEAQYTTSQTLSDAMLSVLA